MTRSQAIPSHEQALSTHPDSRIVLAIRGPGFGAETEPTPAADAAAWILVSLLVFCVAWIVTTALLMKRRLRKQAPPADADSAAQSHCETLANPPPWQRPEDWWKR